MDQTASPIRADSRFVVHTIASVRTSCATAGKKLFSAHFAVAVLIELLDGAGSGRYLFSRELSVAIGIERAEQGMQPP